MTIVSGIEADHSALIKDFVNPRLGATARPTFGHFIPLMSSLADVQRGPEGDKELMPRVGPLPSGKEAAKGRMK
jgi:hypothetical protein